MRIGREFIISILEAIAFITALIGVILGVLGPRTTWPWWATSSLLYAVIFYQSAYYASSVLQIVFITGGVMGWFGWGISGAKPRKSNSKERLIIFVVLGTVTVSLWPILSNIGAASSTIEAFGFVGSVIAQLLMIWQRFEAWPLWLLVDLAYTYQYFKGQLYLTGFLYLIFSVIAIWGWVRWKKESKKFTND